MVMLIEIGKDVVERALNNDSLALDVLRDLAFGFKKCCHVIYTDRKFLDNIEQIDGLSKEEKRVYKIVGQKMTSYMNFYRSFAFHAYVTFDKTTTMTSNMAIINPSEVKDFEWYTRTHLLTENLTDASFYEYVVAYYMRKNKINGFKKESQNIPGGGNTTVQYCKSQIKDKKQFCLAIVDSDLKYKGGSLKETSSKVKECINNIQPFNCQYYVIEDLAEIENMIPFQIISSISQYKNNQIIKGGLQFCQDYFDFKKGLTTDELINEEFYKYWITEIKHLKSISEIVEDYRNKAVKCGSRVAYEKEKQTTLIEGFGEKLLITIMDSNEAKAALRDVMDKDLSPSQNLVWYNMGQIIFEWCCAFRNYKNS